MAKERATPSAASSQTGCLPTGELSGREARSKQKEKIDHKYSYGHKMNYEQCSHFLVLTAPKKEARALFELPEASAIRRTNGHKLTAVTDILLS